MQKQWKAWIVNMAMAIDIETEIQSSLHFDEFKPPISDVQKKTLRWMPGHCFAPSSIFSWEDLDILKEDILLEEDILQEDILQEDILWNQVIGNNIFLPPRSKNIHIS